MLAGILPALREAVQEAAGVDCDTFPLSPDRIVELLDTKEAAAARAARSAKETA
jgi:hypothetical protein